ncbi:MAG: endonuclease/exonuclease/phosphatase family protein [Kofleriaceae bacterium]
MRSLVLSVLVVAACRSIEPYPDAAPAPDTVRVATFNVRRFFDTVCDSGLCGPGDYEEQPTPAEFEQRATQLATAIRGLSADVIALQEVESQACLDALVARIGDVMPYAVLGEIGSVASVDVAVLSRTPLARVVRHRATAPLLLADGTTAKFSRELLEVHVEDGALVVFAAHFRSKANDDPARRLAEAQVARRVVTEVGAREPEAVVVLAGDLNDTPGSPPLAALVDDDGLVRLADDLDAVSQATYSYQGRGQAIDHLLVTRGRGEAARVPRSSRVWHGSPQWGWGGSDHAALTSELVLDRP